MRVVVDTNVLVSIAIRPNQNMEAIFDFLAENGTILVSDATLSELLIVLNRSKFRKYLSAEETADFVNYYSDIAEHIIVTHSVVACRDPNDDKFLSLALSGHADCIIAGDNDLVSMISFNGIPIYRPFDFRQRFVP